MEVKKWNAFISYFVSLKNFYVQNKEDEITIHEISTSLQQSSNKLSTLLCVKPGDLVAAKYENDGLWYRAKILNVQENVYTVQFIDYGNVEILSNVKKLPKQVTGYSALAHHCILDDVDDVEHIVINNNDVYDIIFEFITSIELFVTFLNDKNPYVVKMKWDNRNIKTILNNVILYGITPKTYETLKQFYQIGSTFEVNIVNIISINEFYVEFINSEDIRKKIKCELEERTTWEPVTEYKIGKLAVAISLTDNRWYRVRILEILGKGKCNCYFIDYGVQGNCIQFYEAVDYLESTPPLIKRCSLHISNIKNKNKIFSSLSKSFVDEMVRYNDNKIFMTIVKTGEPLLVDLEVDKLSVAKIIEPKSVVVFCVYDFNLLLVQLNSCGRLTVMNELNNTKVQLRLAEELKIGSIYGAYVDKQWYRVKLITICNHQLMEVIKVDMGGLKIFVKELFYLPPHIGNIEYLYIYCSLNEFDERSNLNKLRQICDEGKTTFTMIVFQSNETDGHRIELFLNDENVSKIIKDN